MEATYEKGKNISDPDQVQRVYEGVVGKKFNIERLEEKALTEYIERSDFEIKLNG